jgi:hypothetical protein
MIGCAAFRSAVRPDGQWPKVDGPTLNGSGNDPHMNTFTSFLTPSRVRFYDSRFDIRTDDGQTLHAGPIKFHALPARLTAERSPISAAKTESQPGAFVQRSPG